MSEEQKPHSSREIALMDLKNCAANGHAHQVSYLRSIEIAGGLVHDHITSLEEQYGALQAAARHVVAREVQARELVGCKTEPRLYAAIATLEGLVGSNPASEPKWGEEKWGKFPRCGAPCPEAPDLEPCHLIEGHEGPWHSNRSSSWPVSVPASEPEGT